VKDPEENNQPPLNATFMQFITRTLTK